MVGGSDAHSPCFPHRPSQKSITQAARGGLQAFTRQPCGRHISAPAEKRHTQARAKALAKGHIRDGITAADAMFKVRRTHVHARFQQQEQERYRISATRERHKGAATRRMGVYAQRPPIHAAISPMSAWLTWASAAI